MVNKMNALKICVKSLVAAMAFLPTTVPAAESGAQKAGNSTDPASRGLPVILANSDGVDLDAVAHFGDHPWYDKLPSTGGNEVPKTVNVRTFEDYLSLRIGPMSQSALLGLSFGGNWNDPVWEIKRDRLKAFGDDPYKAILEFWKKEPKRRFYFDMRMNDGHHQWLNIPGLWTEFRKNNRHLFMNPPTEEEWQKEVLPWINQQGPRPKRISQSIGNPSDWLYDYAKPEVRAHYLAVIKEACRRYDIDGVELDFMRFPIFFKKGEVNAGTMTGFIGEIHEILKAASSGRKEPLRLLVRVPESPENALAIGLDVKEWMRQNWVDALIAGEGWIFSTDPITSWRGITRTHNVPLYGAIERTPQYANRYFVRFGTPEGLRAAVSTLRELGADGIYFFNYVVPQEMSLFAEIADPVKLAALPKEYFVDSGNSATIPAKLGAGEKIKVPLVVGDEPAQAQSLELEVVWDGTDKSMPPTISINGTSLTGFKERPTEFWPDIYSAPNPYRGKRPDNRFTVALTNTEALQQVVKRGKNTVEIQAQEASTLLSISLRVVPPTK